MAPSLYSPPENSLPPRPALLPQVTLSLSVIEAEKLLHSFVAAMWGGMWDPTLNRIEKELRKQLEGTT